MARRHRGRGEMRCQDSTGFLMSAQGRREVWSTTSHSPSDKPWSNNDPASTEHLNPKGERCGDLNPKMDLGIGSCRYTALSHKAHIFRKTGVHIEIQFGQTLRSTARHSFT